jgi:hypothetical protein
MQYLLLIYFGEAWDQLSLAARQQIYGEQRDGKRLVTDGPFAETREQLGGYMLIDVTGLDEAIAIAARGAVARVGTVEVRPVREGPPT